MQNIKCLLVFTISDENLSSRIDEFCKLFKFEKEGDQSTRVSYVDQDVEEMHLQISTILSNSTDKTDRVCLYFAEDSFIKRIELRPFHLV